MAKQRVSKKSVKKPSAAKKKSAGKKKPVPKSAKKSRSVSGKKSSGISYEKKPIESWAADIAEKAYDDARALMKKGADPRKIKVHVFDRSVHDAWE